MKKKNLLFIDQGLAFGGSFIVAARLANHLSEEKYNTTIMTSTDLSDIEHHVSDGVKLVFLRKYLTYKHRLIFQNKLNAIKTPRIIGKIFRKLAIYTYSIVETIANIPYSLSILFYIYKNNVDIVHGNNAFEAITCAHFLGRKIVWHIHNDGVYSKGELNRYLKYADSFISISKFSTANAVASGVPTNKIVTLHNPTGDEQPQLASQDLLRLRAGYAIDQNAIVVGIFGRLINWKGQLEFLRAAKEAAARASNVHFLIVGDDGENFGSYRQTLQSFVEDNELEKRVTFTGYVKNTDAHYRLCQIVVHASILPEPFGLVIIEAMKNSAAVIAANTGAAPELVEHGVSGLIANPSDSTELADAMIFLVENHDKRVLYAEAGKAMVEKNMNPSAYAAQVDSLYSAL